MEISVSEMRTTIEHRKKVVEDALNSPHTSAAWKARVGIKELNILELALEGLNQLVKSNMPKLTSAPLSFDTVPALIPVVDHQTD